MALKRIVLNFIKIVLVSLVILGVFAILMMAPEVGYKGEAQVRVIWGDVIGYLWVDAKCNITYFPFTFPLTWIIGKGHFSGKFLFISKPIYYYTGLNERTMDMYPTILHRSPEDLQREALQRAALKQLYFNLPFLFILLMLVGYLKLQDLYLSILISMLAFSFGNVVVASIVFSTTFIFFLYLRFKFKEGILLKTWKFLVREYEEQRRPEKKLQKLDVKRLPLIYRLLLKLPLPSLESFVQESQGIFWAVIVPVCLVLYAVVGFWTLIYFSFPTNVILFLTVPTIIFLFFLRIMLERFISEWNAMIGGSEKEWNIEKLVDEYLDIVRKRKREV